MLRSIEREASNHERLVLGLGAGRYACSGMIQRIEERAGDELVVRNLRDPELMG